MSFLLFGRIDASKRFFSNGRQAGAAVERAPAGGPSFVHGCDFGALIIEKDADDVSPVLGHDTQQHEHRGRVHPAGIVASQDCQRPGLRRRGADEFSFGLIDEPFHVIQIETDQCSNRFVFENDS